MISALVITGGTKATGRLLTLSEKGFGKQTNITAFKTQKRGGSGIKAAALTEKTGSLVGAHILTGEEGEIITMSKKGRMVRMETKDIPKRGRQTQGVHVMSLKQGDILTASTHM